jgi:hypothetical protein
MDKAKKYADESKVQMDIEEKKEENMSYLEEDGPHYEAYVNCLLN